MKNIRLIKEVKKIIPENFEGKVFDATDCNSLSLPFSDGEFDAVTGVDSKCSIDEIYRVLKQKGKFIAGYSELDDIPAFRAKLKSKFNVNSFYIKEYGLYFSAEKREM